MKNGESLNYKFGTKNHWRRTIWNRIVERLFVPAKDAVVLYLAGEQDLDRTIAVAKGFQSHNLIAIDRSKRVVKMLRNNGTLALHGNLIEVIGEWQNLKVDVVFADCCSGVSPEVAFLAIKLGTAESFKDSVLAFNLMRGRDYWKGFSDQDGSWIGKHRGLWIAGLNAGSFQAVVPGIAAAIEYQALRGRSIAEWATERAMATPLSYKSKSGQIFDSVVWRNCSMWEFLRDQETFFQIECARNGIAFSGTDVQAFVDRRQKTDTSKPITRQIAAIKATRTRIMSTQ